MSRMSAVAGYCCKSIFTPARGIIVRNPTAGDFPCFLPTPANPDATLTAVAKAAGVSRSTVVNARGDQVAEARKQARKEARKLRENPVLAKQTEPRARAALPPRHARARPQAGNRRRGGSRKGPRRSANAGPGTRRSRYRHQPRQRRQYALRAVELARLGHRL